MRWIAFRYNSKIYWHLAEAVFRLISRKRLLLYQDIIYFQVFYVSHLMYIPYLMLLIVHAPDFWKWILIPGLIFIVEWGYRTISVTIGRGKSHIITGNVLPSR